METQPKFVVKDQLEDFMKHLHLEIFTVTHDDRIHYL